MQSLWSFPDPRAERRRRIRAFQQLTPDERVRDLMDTIETGFLLIRESPNREQIERLDAKRRAEWRRIQMELFKQHGF